MKCCHSKIADLLFLPAQLLLLETHALARELFGEDGRVLGVRVDRPGELLGTVRLVEQVVGQRLQISQVGAIQRSVTWIYAHAGILT